MPASYRIDTEQKMISSTATGVVTDQDLRGHQKSLLADPAFDPGFSQIWDFQGVEEALVSNDTLKELAAARSFSSQSRRAVVAPRDVVFGMARMFEMLHQEAPEAFRVFRTAEEARSWLALS